MMAVLLELHYDKREILEAYLNEVFLGQDGQRAVHGFGLASQYFFSQPLSELKLHQVALLVGMVKGPSQYNPRRARNLVLDLLAEQGIVTPEEAAEAKAAAGRDPARQPGGQLVPRVPRPGQAPAAPGLR